jgi:peptidoglycan/xylan/chitin deacetylase (PgdA/CDA1 family)
MRIGAFIAQLAWVNRRFRVVPASALFGEAQARSRGDPIPVALTFDDDLASHATLAAPALEARGLPGTFFLGGTALEQQASRPWWEVLEDAADQAPREALGGVSLDAAANAMEAMPRDEREQEVERLARLVGSGTSDPPLDVDGVRRLTDSGMEIGFHTRHHERLPSLTGKALLEALTDGRDRLERLTGAPIRSIAYPHGAANQEVVDGARSSGYDTGFTTEWATIGAETDRLRIGRLYPARSRVGLTLWTRIALGRGRTTRATPEASTASDT